MTGGDMVKRMIPIALWAALAACASGNLDGEESMDLLKKQVLEKNQISIARAKQLGRKANPVLLELAKHPDAEVRLVAVYSLRETGGSEVFPGLISALSDPDLQVAGAAAFALDRLFDPTLAATLTQVYDRSPHPSIRHKTALLIGRADRKADPTELRKRLEAEKNPEAAEGCLVALARLGDKAAREEVVNRLQASRGPVRRRFLAHGMYIGAPWILKPLIPVLDDQDELVHSGIDAKPELNREIRACDLAVNLVGALSDRKFSFKVVEFGVYTEPQVEEVRRYLKTLP
jgi:HEAT repeat protein